VDAKIRGLVELDRALAEIGAVAGAKVMRSSMFTATKPILDRAKANMPSHSGALREALSRIFAVSKRPGDYEFNSRSSGFGSGQARGFGISAGDGGGSRFSILIGPKVRHRVAIALYNLVHRTKRKGIYHGHFVEFDHRIGNASTGTLSRAQTVAGMARAARRGKSFGAGMVSGKHVLRNALMSASSQAVALLAQTLKKRIEIAAKKR
jgi:hypothetical protein